jgi:hypothetical protein
MSDGEMAYMALVLTGLFSFVAVLFTISGGFRDTSTKQQPTARPDELPSGSAKAAA